MWKNKTINNFLQVPNKILCVLFRDCDFSQGEAITKEDNALD